jgi:hypothetical protein
VIKRALWRYVAFTPILVVLAIVECIGEAAGEIGERLAKWVARGTP